MNQGLNGCKVKPCQAYALERLNSYLKRIVIFTVAGGESSHTIQIVVEGPWLQWEFQDPKIEVLYHIRPYFVGIFPYIGLI